ncbi:DNA-binding response regulator [Microgenomates group bacterium RBG_16_45_19]|nr:MAG: DNA-binding response regulator [Microgenomates group bacterium RBG_16_45_19]
MKILVVEDERRIAHYLKQGLELKAHLVDTAEDGEVGLDLALGENYDLLIVDWLLPKLNGYNLVKQVRAEGKTTPILMLTARTQVADRVAGLEAGADDYLNKPFAFSELLARVNALSRRPADFKSSQLTAGNLKLDIEIFAVSRAGKAVKLTKKEFQLLEFLLRHQGKVLTAEQLITQVWPYDSDVLPNTAQVYIGYLRRKIDQSFPQEKPLIMTVRGFGYKLEG